MAFSEDFDCKPMCQVLIEATELPKQSNTVTCTMKHKSQLHDNPGYLFMLFLVGSKTLTSFEIANLNPYGNPLKGTCCRQTSEVLPTHLFCCWDF